jgi:hypothetical protein
VVTSHVTPHSIGIRDESARRSLYLMGAMTRNEVQSYVRSLCVDAEVARLPEILISWRSASARFNEIVAADPYQAPATGPILDLDDDLAALSNDALFQSTFSQLPTSFAMVEVDKLIAPQRSLHLEFVEQLKAELSTGVTPRDLVAACMSIPTQPGPLSAIQSAPNMAVYSSENRNLRFLGGFMKPLDATDVAVAHTGGVPAAAVVLLVGYGSPCVNVIQFEDRMVLNNGFHRAYAIRALGHKRIPVVVQHAENVDLEFPQSVAGLPREYLLKHRRPVVMRDFFDDQLVTTLSEKVRRKTVTLQWGNGEMEVPV